LLSIRVAAEAVLMSVPGGALACEALKVYLVGRRFGVPASDVAATLGIKRCLVVSAHGVYLTLAGVVALGLLRAPRAVGGVLLAVGVVMLAVAVLLARLLAGGRLGNRLHHWLQRLPFKPVRRWLDAHQQGFVSADGTLVSLARDVRASVPRAALPFLLQWLTEAFETWLLLRLLGVPIEPAQALVVEAGASALRHLAVFVPAGLGVQDLGYLGLLRWLSVPGGAAVGGVFVVVKRAKELVWIGVGYLILLADGLPASRAARPRPAPAPP
jgi:uncharacterized protein (TIRG00374 family)